jgi:hypothetical protein
MNPHNRYRFERALSVASQWLPIALVIIGAVGLLDAIFHHTGSSAFWLLP